MEKQIVGYPDHTRAVIKGLTVDGLILCDIYGSLKVETINEQGEKQLVDMPLFDENVSITNGKFFTLTKNELEEWTIQQ